MWQYIKLTNMLWHTYRLREEASPTLNRMTSPTSEEYENDKSDFDLSPKCDEQEGNSQDHNLSKKAITRSKTEMIVTDVKHPTTKDRHSVKGILNSTTGVHTGTTKQNKFSFLPKKRNSSGEYPPIPPKPIIPSGSSTSSLKTSTSPKVSKNTSAVSLNNQVSPNTDAKSPSPDVSVPKTSTPNSLAHSPRRGSHGRSHTLKKKDTQDDRFASRCATMGSQQAFHEHHMNKKRRKKSSDKSIRRLTTLEGDNPTRISGNASSSSNKFEYQFSPDMEERLQLKIEQGIENTYGPIEKCIQAAITIQRYYRQQKMLQRFKTLRKEVISVASLHPSRPRAASMKLPVRAHSIRLKSNADMKVSILDEFPEYRKLTSRIASRNQISTHPLQVASNKSGDLGPTVRWRREASLEIQETVLQITDKSITPVRELSDDTGNDDNVFSPGSTPSPEVAYSPSADSDSSQDIKQKTAGVPTSLSVDFLNTGHEEEQTTRPHSISIMSHIIRSRSMEELLVMDNKMGKPKKQQLKSQESATTLKKKTNVGITLFNRLVDPCGNINTIHYFPAGRKPAKGILYLVLQGVLKDSPNDVAHFIRTQYGLSKAMIGKFFSELHNEFSMAVLEWVLYKL